MKSFYRYMKGEKTFAMEPLTPFCGWISSASVLSFSIYGAA